MPATTSVRARDSHGAAPTNAVLAVARRASFHTVAMAWAPRSHGVVVSTAGDRPSHNAPSSNTLPPSAAPRRTTRRCNTRSSRSTTSNIEGWRSDGWVAHARTSSCRSDRGTGPLDNCTASEGASVCANGCAPSSASAKDTAHAHWSARPSMADDPRCSGAM